MTFAASLAGRPAGTCAVFGIWGLGHAVTTTCVLRTAGPGLVPLVEDVAFEGVRPVQPPSKEWRFAGLR
jgi:hypothetical protein